MKITINLGLITNLWNDNNPVEKEHFRCGNCALCVLLIWRCLRLFEWVGDNSNRTKEAVAYIFLKIYVFKPENSYFPNYRNKKKHRF
jgi:hypothetical protein